MVKERQKEYRGTYVKFNIIGTCLCVLSPVSLFAAAIEDNDFFTVIMLGVMLFVAGVGSVFFIVAGVKNAAMEKLLKTGQYSEEKREQKKEKIRIKGTISTIYWMLVTAAYLLWLFLDRNNNSLSWVIFPVAGVLFPAVLGIISLAKRKPQDKDKL